MSAYEFWKIVAEIRIVATGGFKGDVKPSQKWASRQLDRANADE